MDMHQASRLTPAEAMLLLEPRSGLSTRLFKLSAMGLLMRRVLRAQSVQKTGWRARGTEMRIQAFPGPALPAHEAAVVEVVRVAARKNAQGATALEVVAAARKTFGASLDSYRKAQVLPALVGRGLIEMKRGGLFRFKRATLTPAGEAAQAELKALLDRARQVPAWLDTNPGQAAATAASLGLLVLLVEELKPHMRRLAQAAQAAAVDDPSSYHQHHGGTDGARGEPKDGGAGAAGAEGLGAGMLAGGLMEGGRDGQGAMEGSASGAFDGAALDMGAFDLATLDMTGFDDSAFDSMESAMSSFDAVPDSGGSDSGSDSGSSSDSSGGG